MKKSNFKKIIFMVIFLIMLSVSKKVNAAIQMVPSITRLTNVTLDQSFVTCRGLDSLTSTLRIY